METKNDAAGFLKVIGICLGLSLLVIPVMLIANKKGAADRSRYFDPAESAYSRGNYAEADQEFEQDLSFEGGYSQVYYELGLAQLMEGHFDNAAESFNDSISISGTKATAWCGNQRCEDASRAVLSWMKTNPNQIPATPPPLHPN